MLVPIILGSDETQLMQFGGDKKGWPVYVTIGNIWSTVWQWHSKQAMKLLAYLLIGNSEGLSGQEKSAYHAKVFHDCMVRLVKPLIAASMDGVIM